MPNTLTIYDIFEKESIHALILDNMEQFVKEIHWKGRVLTKSWRGDVFEMVWYITKIIDHENELEQLVCRCFW